MSIPIPFLPKQAHGGDTFLRTSVVRRILRKVVRTDHDISKEDEMLINLLYSLSPQEQNEFTEWYDKHIEASRKRSEKRKEEKKQREEDERKSIYSEVEHSVLSKSDSARANEILRLRRELAICESSLKGKLLDTESMRSGLSSTRSNFLNQHPSLIDYAADFQEDEKSFPPLRHPQSEVGSLSPVRRVEEIEVKEHTSRTINPSYDEYSNNRWKTNAKNARILSNVIDSIDPTARAKLKLNANGTINIKNKGNIAYLRALYSYLQPGDRIPYQAKDIGLRLITLYDDPNIIGFGYTSGGCGCNSCKSQTLKEN